MIAKRGRVLYTWNGGEIFIEYDDLDEKIAFNSDNGIGFTASTVEDMEKIVKGTESAIKVFKANITDIKDIVCEKAPALLGYEGYTSTREIKKKELESRADKVLSKMKAYTDIKEEDAI